MAEPEVSNGDPVPPSETIYIRNLSEKIKLPDLKEQLHKCFEPFGTVLDVVAHKNIRMRGQAFVVFDNMESASKAKDSLNNKDFSGKPMLIQFAKAKSDVIVQKTQSLDKFLEHKQTRLAKKEQFKAIFEKHRKAASNKDNQNNSTHDNPQKRPVPGSEDQDQDQNHKKQKSEDKADHKAALLPPNKILFLENLAEGTEESEVVEIFSKFAGFFEARMVSVRHVAFVEFEDESSAVTAKSSLGDTLEINGQSVSVSYAKK